MTNEQRVVSEIKRRGHANANYMARYLSIGLDRTTEILNGLSQKGVITEQDNDGNRRTKE